MGREDRLDKNKPGPAKNNGTCSNGVVCAYAFAAVAAAAARPTLLLPLLLLLLHTLNALLMLPRVLVVAQVVIHYTHVQVDVLVMTYSPDYVPATYFFLPSHYYVPPTTFTTCYCCCYHFEHYDPTSLPFLRRHVAQLLSRQSKQSRQS